MNKTLKILLWIFGSIAVLFTLLIILNNYLEKKIKSTIQKELDSSYIQYSEIDVDIINRNASVSDLKFKRGKFNVTAKEIELAAFNYSDYFLNNKITIGEIVLNVPTIILEPSDSLPKNRKKADQKFKENITIKKFRVSNGIMKIKDSSSVQGSLYIDIKNLDLNGIMVNSKTLEGVLPFKYDSYSLKSDSIFYGLDADHDLSVGKLGIANSDVIMSDIKIFPKFSKSDFDKRQKVEKDRMNLEIKKVNIQNFGWNFEKDTLELASPKINIDAAIWEIYRNKLIPDPTTIKPLYSKLLREMGVKLKFDSVVIYNSHITYEERVKEDRASAIFKFGQINATISNLTNVGMDRKDFPETKLSAKAKFMEEANISMDLVFKVSDLNDNFHVSGNLYNLSGSDMNGILKPEMNILAEGQIQSVYYNFYGNDNAAEGATQLKYEDFKIEVLRKDGQKKNKILSGLVNLVVNNNAKNKNLTQSDLKIQRVKTKSFWNYFWLCIRAGALKSFI
ncbi:hypothetical protein [Gillisia sp. Hel_I_29]|uniref:hypothetical protein n=1 Tax=Gillisia sp. Hel_I_29 TaxID=1249975 RepID=UPI0012E07973|nr:hypothetical protein [Gillisia sp. Hel_I_29]